MNNRLFGGILYVITTIRAYIIRFIFVGKKARIVDVCMCMCVCDHMSMEKGTESIPDFQEI